MNNRDVEILEKQKSQYKLILIFQHISKKEEKVTNLEKMSY